MAKTFSKENLTRLQTLIDRFPNKQSVIMNAMRLAEEEFGYVDKDVCTYLAELLDVSASHLFGIMNFYTHFKREHHGTYRIMICGTLMCEMNGSASVQAHLKSTLGIGIGERTADGKFSLETVECLAACHRSPVMQINDQTYYELTPEKIDRILAELKKK